MSEVPEQLQNEDFRFVKIQSGKKWPFEKNWQKDGNYKYNDEEFKKWSKNYGVVCGFGNLTVIDADNEVTEEAVEENLPDTFTVQTGGGGKHYYYICNDIQKPIRLKQEEYGDLGDVQFEGKQVVGPGSRHPSGNTYKVVKDKEIEEISASQIKIALKDLIKDSTAHDVKKEEEKQSKEKDLDIDLDITEVVDLTGLKKRGNEYQGPHPVHGSKTGQNFTVNPRKNVWHCFRKNCDSGGGPLSWIAVKEGIISCSEAQPGSLSGDKFKQVLEVAQEKYDLDVDVTNDEDILSSIRQLTEKNGNGTNGTISMTSVSKKGNNSMSLHSNDDDKLVPMVPEETRKKVWEKLKSVFKKSDVTKNQARYFVAQAFQKMYNFKTHPKTEELFVFNDHSYKPTGRNLIKKHCRRELGSDVTRHDVKEIVSMVKDENFVDMEDFKVDDLIVPVKNADLEITNDGEIVEHKMDPERVIMSRIPWEYDPEAECPEIKDFLKDIVKEEWIPTIQEMIGLSLSNKHVSRKAFMLYGSGSNGKDVLIDVIENLLGKENVSNHSLHNLELNRFAAAGLVGKRANICGDLSDRELKSTSKFKRITGGSTIQVEKKGKDSYNYKPTSTLIFAANQTPNLKEDSYALFDRWVIITFPYTFTSDPDDGNKMKVPKKEMKDKLLTPEEMRGLLKWAIEGLQRVIKRGGKVTNEQSPERIKEAWEKRSDSTTAFVKNKIKRDPENVIPKRELYNKYTDWCVKNDYSPESMRKLSRDLPTKCEAKADSERINNKKTKVWKGIALKSEERNGVETEDVLDLYPEPISDPMEYSALESKARNELDLEGEEFYEIHEYLEKEGSIHEPRSGRWKKV